MTKSCENCVNVFKYKNKNGSEENIKMSNKTNMFNSPLHLDCFCMDVAEAWIKYRKSINKEASYDEFMEWVMNDLVTSLDYNFDDILEEFED